MITTVISVMMVGVIIMTIAVVVSVYKEATEYESVEKSMDNLLELLSIITARQYEIQRRLNQLEEKGRANDDYR